MNVDMSPASVSLEGIKNLNLQEVSLDAIGNDLPKVSLESIGSSDLSEVSLDAIGASDLPEVFLGRIRSENVSDSDSIQEVSLDAIGNDLPKVSLESIGSSDLSEVSLDSIIPSSLILQENGLKQILEKINALVDELPDEVFKDKVKVGGYTKDELARVILRASTGHGTADDFNGLYLVKASNPNWSLDVKQLEHDFPPQEDKSFPSSPVLPDDDVSERQPPSSESASIFPDEADHPVLSPQEIAQKIKDGQDALVVVLVETAKDKIQSDTIETGVKRLIEALETNELYSSCRAVNLFEEVKKSASEEDYSKMLEVLKEKFGLTEEVFASLRKNAMKTTKDIENLEAVVKSAKERGVRGYREKLLEKAKQTQNKEGEFDLSKLDSLDLYLVTMLSRHLIGEAERKEEAQPLLETAGLSEEDLRKAQFSGEALSKLPEDLKIKILEIREKEEIKPNDEEIKQTMQEIATRIQKGELTLEEAFSLLRQNNFVYDSFFKAVFPTIVKLDVQEQPLLIKALTNRNLGKETEEDKTVLQKHENILKININKGILLMKEATTKEGVIEKIKDVLKIDIEDLRKLTRNQSEQALEQNQQFMQGIKSLVDLFKQGILTEKEIGLLFGKKYSSRLFYAFFHELYPNANLEQKIGEQSDEALLNVLMKKYLQGEDSLTQQERDFLKAQEKALTYQPLTPPKEAEKNFDDLQKEARSLIDLIKQGKDVDDNLERLVKLVKQGKNLVSSTEQEKNDKVAKLYESLMTSNVAPEKLAEFHKMLEENKQEKDVAELKEVAKEGFLRGKLERFKKLRRRTKIVVVAAVTLAGVVLGYKALSPAETQAIIDTKPPIVSTIEPEKINSATLTPTPTIDSQKPIVPSATPSPQPSKEEPMLDDSSTPTPTIDSQKPIVPSATPSPQPSNKEPMLDDDSSVNHNPIAGSQTSGAASVPQEAENKNTAMPKFPQTITFGPNEGEFQDAGKALESVLRPYYEDYLGKKYIENSIWTHRKPIIDKKTGKVTGMTQTVWDVWAKAAGIEPGPDNEPWLHFNDIKAGTKLPINQEIINAAGYMYNK